MRWPKIVTGLARLVSGELMAKTLKQTEERVAEVKRRAEEAVSDVKRQAVVELQKAVRAAEEKANEAVASAHGKMEKAVLEARRQATEDTLAMSNHQSDSSEVGHILHIFLMHSTIACSVRCLDVRGINY